jgi:hypothetical protein
VLGVIAAVEFSQEQLPVVAKLLPQTDFARVCTNESAAESRDPPGAVI